MSSQTTTMALVLVGCCCVSAVTAGGLWAGNVFCDTTNPDSQAVGMNCAAVYERSPAPAPAPAALTPKQTLLASGQAIQVAPLEIGTPSKFAFSRPPTGYTPSTLPSYTMTFDIQVKAVQSDWRNILAHDDTYRTPAVFICPSNHPTTPNTIQIYHGPSLESKNPIVMDGSTWTTITWTASQEKIQLYINGMLDNSVSTSTAWPSPDPVWNWNDTTRALPSTSSIKVRNVYFWPSARTDAQIALLGASGMGSETTSGYMPEPFTAAKTFAGY